MSDMISRWARVWWEVESITTLGLFIFGGGITGVIARLTGREQIFSWYPGDVGMAFETGIAFIMTGLAFFIAGRRIKRLIVADYKRRGVAIDPEISTE